MARPQTDIIANRSIVFLDAEIDPQRAVVLDIGCVNSSGATFHRAARSELIAYLRGTTFLCGHNIIAHDLPYLKQPLQEAGIQSRYIIDTLLLSPLLFPVRPYHSLVKDEKLQSEEVNNPLNDAHKARDLFHDEVSAFLELPVDMQQLYGQLLADQPGFEGFFHYVDWRPATGITPNSLIKRNFHNEYCSAADIDSFVSQHPVALAYALALLYARDRYSITPPWVLRNFPHVERLLFLLRSTPCQQGCNYCNEALNIHAALRSIFGFEHFRTYDGEPLQQKAAQAAVDNQSLLAIFPTGGGKSITFQLPALMSGAATKGLTVVISPLQSLMKDQVDNLEEAGITDAVTINGLLDPIERAKSIERVASGLASLLYLSPESLRSPTIQRLLMGRQIVRFVIDEAHCFSAWGQDFRVDYLYIGDFIRSLQEQKQLSTPIPVSCFTATAKPQVIEDIQAYFRKKLGLDLILFRANVRRANLQFRVIQKNSEEEKYDTLRELIADRQVPTIVYVGRTRKAADLAARLREDGFSALAYHGKMDPQDKTANQNAFLAGEVPIMVATSAFGMGVDKKDVGLVVHFEISDSLENYIQEAGRAGRDQSISAECLVLYNEEDLNGHFVLLNQTKLSIKEIQQVWRAVKQLTRYRRRLSHSALEIARKAGWDDSVRDIETRVRTAIAALEEAGYLTRGLNQPRMYANSILARTAQEAIDRIRSSPRFEGRQQQAAIRIIRKLFSSKRRKLAADEEAESRVDYISDHLGIVREEVIRIIHSLREEGILADAKDLVAFLRQDGQAGRLVNWVKRFRPLEELLLAQIREGEETQLDLRALNEAADQEGLVGSSVAAFTKILTFWSIKNWVRIRRHPFSRNHLSLHCQRPLDELREQLAKRYELGCFFIEYLHKKVASDRKEGNSEQREVAVEFSVQELQEAYTGAENLSARTITQSETEEALFYLSRIGALVLDGGFMVIYQRMTIDRLEEDNRIQYKLEDYKKLSRFYAGKVQQIHIVGEYAQCMISDYEEALQFVEDYFQLQHEEFLTKYFPGNRKDEIRRNITPAKFAELFGALSPAQLRIINDNDSPHILVAAGPGSGKTRVLVHKLASLLLMEDVKHEQLLMLTFSRAAATEFKKRLVELIGNAAAFIEIKTFHSYCFDLLGRVGSLEKSDNIIRTAVTMIRDGEVELNRITKTVLVIDEAQDMNQAEYALVEALMAHNEEMRVIAVGDDDQNIYTFRGADSRFLRQLIHDRQATPYELVENYRSRANLVAFANRFIQQLPDRLKRTPIQPVQQENGTLRLVRYDPNPCLVSPVVSDLLAAKPTGTTGLLTRTNRQAWRAAGLILQRGHPAKLIQDQKDFSPYDLAEVRFFLRALQLQPDEYRISDEKWQAAHQALTRSFERSHVLPLTLRLLALFETVSPRGKYQSDLETYLRESRLQDFYEADENTVLVSTIHKAKGKEFDNVWLLLHEATAGTPERIREVYVAMTRAKKQLSIHVDTDMLDHILVDGLTYTRDNAPYTAPARLSVHLGHEDVYLSYFKRHQQAIALLQAGDELTIHDGFCARTNGEPVLRFSSSFNEKIAEMEAGGYRLQSVRINFIVHWYDKAGDREWQVVLPEVRLGKAG